MRSLHTFRVFAVALLALGMSATAVAELQQVTVGGEIRIRGQFWKDVFYPGSIQASIAPSVRVPAELVTRRPIGDPWLGDNVVSFFKWGDDNSDLAFFEQRTEVNVRADFTDNVSAYIALESWGVWGDQTFRSDYVTGVDSSSPGGGADDISLYEAYIEAREMWGAPLRLRIGRQELVLGSGWLVGNNTNFTEFRGLSFDAVRLTYTPGDFAVDAFWSKVAENSFILGDNQDIDFMGVYGAYTGLEDIRLEAYWLWLRDSVDLNDTTGGPVLEWAEDLFNVDDYEETNLHTLGLRAAGTMGQFDFEAEAAYQLGSADRIGFRFRPGTYGDDDADFDAFGANVELGYTFDVTTQPRIFVHGAYLGGEDNRDISFWEWLRPRFKRDASVSFNRLFSNKVYSYFIDENSYLSNTWLVGGGVQLWPTESVHLEAKATYFSALEEFDLPRHIRIGGTRIFWTGPLSFLTTESASSLGWDLSLTAAYHYSEDLVFRAGWAHFFLGEGLEDGNFVDLNGLLLNGASDDRKDGNYFFVETELRF